MQHTTSSSFFGGLARLALSRRRAILLITVVLVGLSVWATTRLDFASSRYSLVAADHPYQARLLRFFDRFGHPETPIFVVRGANVEQRHRAVDQLQRELDAEALFTHRVLGRLDVSTFAELAFVRDPSQVTEAMKSLGGPAQVQAALAQGPAGLVRLIRQGVEQGLENGNQPSSDAAEAELNKLHAMVVFLRKALTGQAPDQALRAMDSRIASMGEAGVDADGYLTSADGSINLVAVFPAISKASAQELAEIVGQARHAQARARAAIDHPDVEILLTGLPVLTVDEESALAEGLRVTTIATTLGIVALLWFGLRSLRHALLALLPLGLGSALGMGALYIIFGHINLVTSSFLAVLLGLGIDFAVHLLARFQEDVRRGEAEPIVSAVKGSGPGVFTGMLTTVAAFLTLAGAEFTAYGEMGIITAVGLLIVCLATYLVLPGLLAQPWAHPANLHFAPIPGIQMLGRWILLRYRWPVVCGVVLAITGAALIGQLRFNPRYFDFLPESRESSRALAVLENEPGMGPVFAYVSADSIERARQLALLLKEPSEGEPLVGIVQSPSDFLPPLDPLRLQALGDLATLGQATLQSAPPALRTELQREVIALSDALEEVGHALRAAGKSTKALVVLLQDLSLLRDELTAATNPTDGATPRSLDQREAALGDLAKWMIDVVKRAGQTAGHVAQRGHYSVEDLPAILRARYAAKDGSSAVALFVYPARNLWDDRFAGRFVEHVEHIDPGAAGHALSLHHHNKMIVRDFQRAALWAVLAIIFLVWLDFRNVRCTALALFPVSLGWLWLMAVIAASGRTFDAANIVCLPLVLGIGIDAGVHVMHRVRESEREHGVARLVDVMQGTGTAVFLSSATTLCGFAGLMVAEYGAMVSLGWMMVVGVACTTFAALVVLPALLVWLGRLQGHPRAQ